MASLNFDYLLEVTIFKYSHIGVKATAYGFGRRLCQSIAICDLNRDILSLCVLILYTILASNKYI